MTATAIRPPGLAKAASDAAWAREVADRHAIETAQATNAAQIKIERLARREPIIADLLEEHRALKATVDTLRGRHAELEAEFARVARENADLKVQLDAAPKPKSRS